VRKIFAAMNCLAMIIGLFSVNASAQNCNQSFNVDVGRPLPGMQSLAPFNGWSCGQLERYRVSIFVSNQSAVTEREFADLKTWRKARTDLLNRIEAADQQLLDATTSQQIQVAVTLVLHEAGMMLTLLGCPTAVTGVGAVTCVGGIVITEAGTIWSLASSGSTKTTASAALDNLRAVLRNHDSISIAELDAAQKNYEAIASELCNIVTTYCIK